MFSIKCSRSQFEMFADIKDYDHLNHLVFDTRLLRRCIVVQFVVV